ncbi:MAG: HAD-IA family hydrolase [Candidatus Methanoplasma sp.]|jgi:HAD superfamily hydrolase (TIGR01509 family)|nr:HAD-IA family hydrolase [Candidatus Methanoplasma sp.]
MKEYGAYLFDMDNTIVDSSKGYEKAFRAAFKEYGIPYDHSRYGEYIRTPLEKTFAKHHDAAPCKFRDFYSIFAATYDRTHMDSVALFPDAAECIAALARSGKSLGVVSNSNTRYIIDILSDLGIRDLFGSLVGLDRVPTPKPDPAPVLLCMRELGAEPSDAVMIGDSGADVAAGCSAGADTVLVVRDGARVAECSPTYRVSDLAIVSERPFAQDRSV